MSLLDFWQASHILANKDDNLILNEVIQFYYPLINSMITATSYDIGGGANGDVLPPLLG